jgi:hypothetical protein
MTDSVPNTVGKRRSRKRYRKPRPPIPATPAAPEAGPDMTIAPAIVAEVGLLMQRLDEVIGAAKQSGLVPGFIVSALYRVAQRETQLII